MAHEHNHEEHNHEGHNHNPLDNLDEDTQIKIQEIQIMEQSFQRLLMQKNAFAMEANETELVLTEVNKATGDFSRIIGGQVIVKTTKEKIIEDMNRKKQLISVRLKEIEKQEKEFSEKIEELRDEIMKKIQG